MGKIDRQATPLVGPPSRYRESKSLVFSVAKILIGYLRDGDNRTGIIYVDDNSIRRAREQINQAFRLPYNTWLRPRVWRLNEWNWIWRIPENRSCLVLMAARRMRVAMCGVYHTLDPRNPLKGPRRTHRRIWKQFSRVKDPAYHVRRYRALRQEQIDAMPDGPAKRRAQSTFKEHCRRNPIPDIRTRKREGARHADPPWDKGRGGEVLLRLVDEHGFEVEVMGRLDAGEADGCDDSPSDAPEEGAKPAPAVMRGDDGRQSVS